MTETRLAGGLKQIELFQVELFHRYASQRKEFERALVERALCSQVGSLKGIAFFFSFVLVFFVCKQLLKDIVYPLAGKKHTTYWIVWHSKRCS